MIEANDGGANVSVNGGETLDGPGLSDRRSSTTSSRPSTCRITSAARSRTTARRASSSQAGRRRRRQLAPIFYAVGGGESGYIAPDPRDPDVFYAGSYGGLLTRLDRRTGQERAINIYPDNPMGYASADITERFQWTFPIVFAPTDPEDALRRLAAPLEDDQRAARAGSGSAPT